MGELGGAGGDGGGEVRVGDGLPDHAPGGGLVGGDGLGEERGAHGAGEADLAGQPVGAAGVGDQADAGEGLDEDGGVARRSTTSQASARLAPAPAAAPLTAAMVGIGQS